jgi:hypothetical protein
MVNIMIGESAGKLLSKVSSIWFWRWRMIIRINVLLDCVHRPRFHKTWISLRFVDWLCPPTQVYKISGGGRLKIE